ncbi:MAG: chemotaxis response regulator protein-glutamate methylesterase [Deltaproteobacteria bacterium]|nr:chemotaxis response regulator protein-glutamate methylesterase [Deltaproteobacteria bacterium]
MEKIKVLIVDDSAVVRQTLEKVLSSDREIEVVGTAPDPYAAAKKMKTLVPDVITLDVEMPRMDGITFLKKIMSQHPIPVVICSSLTGKGSETALKALEYGAVEIIHKPLVGTKQFIEESNILICDVVKAAAQTRKGRTLKKTTVIEPTKKLSADVILRKADKKAMVQTTEKVVVVGASTGGTEALRVFLEALPYDSPGIVVVQHMPENFTSAFAERLNQLCQVSVKEAANNDSVLPGHVLIAPGNKHTLLKRSGARYYVEVKDGPLVSRHRPSVDVLFRSASRYAGKNVCGVILTGMGDDGAKGMLEMKETGAINIAQDEATCVVFGMPNEAIKAGGVDQVLPLQAIAGKVIQVSGY